jgi:hypothetical protein
MSGWSLARLVLSVVCASALVSACSGDPSPPADYRGDPLCQNAVVTEGQSCDLSISLHGHTYLLTCDLSQQSCDCRRDGRPAGLSQFGGSTTPTCTLEYLDFEWSDCCGTPD